MQKLEERVSSYPSQDPAPESPSASRALSDVLKAAKKEAKSKNDE
jgi:hypothetical protein